MGWDLTRTINRVVFLQFESLLSLHYILQLNFFGKEKGIRPVIPQSHFDCYPYLTELVPHFN